MSQTTLEGKSKSPKDVLPEVVGMVKNSLKFYGVEIHGVDLGEIPTFRVSISKSGLKESLEKTLDLTYWTLRTLVSQGVEDQDSVKINVEYKEVE